MKITKPTEITINGETYLLEEGDEIVEGLISKALLSILNKFIPIDILNKMDPQIQRSFASILQDPEKAQKFSRLARKNPEFLDLFT